MNNCLDSLAAEYPTVKFCRITATDARLSWKFVSKMLGFCTVFTPSNTLGTLLTVQLSILCLLWQVVNGVPALLIYKAGQLIGNFIRLSDEFGQEFYPGDVANFLVE
jgi:hypothetical protein